MNYPSKTNFEILQLIKEKCKIEKTMTLEIVSLTREVDSRKIYQELGYSSMFQFSIEELGLEESEAVRRIAAARLLNEIPEAEIKLFNGSLCLTNICHAQTFFNKEKKLRGLAVALEEKREILALLENKTTRQVQKILFELSPDQSLLRESVRLVGDDHYEMKFIISEDILEKLKKLKGLLSHRFPVMTYSELISEMTDIALEKLDPARKGRASPSAQTVKNESAAPKQGRNIPQSVRQKVWIRDQGRCTYENPVTRHRCRSQYQIEIHHEVPFGMGGHSDVNNLKLFCRRHNKLAAIRDYGAEKMNQYFSC
jgi:hypothetical protein